MIQKPAKTFADYLVIAISPVLIMLLVGSLAFFLIQVFYRGEMVHGIRWVMFWFVFAIVLVSRIGIEQSKGHAIGYGAALAVTMWIYFAFERAMPVLGVFLLAITWWCAHKLTVDCTLINDEQDASGEGVLQNLWRKVEQSVEPPRVPPLPMKPRLTPIELLVAEDLAKRRKRGPPPQSPGKWVIYFSLAALPLFGLGQLLLPADNPEARRAGFEFLAVYLGAALSLLMTTSFLGLRRYLRQRSVEMSTSVALGWVRFGGILAGAVLFLALVLPRPGASNTWKKLTYEISHKTNKASDYELPFNPPGEGDGTPADEQKNNDQPVNHSQKDAPGSGPQPTHDNGQGQSQPTSQPSNPNQSAGSGQSGGKDGAGQGSQSGESSGAGKSGTPKDNSPTGDSDQSDGHGQSAGNDGSPDGDGKNANRPPGNNTPPPEHRQSGKDSPRKDPVDKKQNPVAPEQKPIEQPQSHPGTPEPHHTDLHVLLRVLLIIALAALFIWVVVRYRKAIAQAIRNLIAAVREFFQKCCSVASASP